jgi:hypothetical protein
MALRGRLQLAANDLLDPYKLAPLVGLQLVDAHEVCSCLAPEISKHILVSGKDDWSGGVLAEALPDGSRICILNPTHHPRRRKITLMEEIAHVHLRHVPSRLIRHANGLRMRDYNKPQEEEAFGVGAASLLPWGSFFLAVNRGMCVADLAERYEVSEDLIRYRIQITAASKLYHARQRTGK